MGQKRGQVLKHHFSVILLVLKWMKAINARFDEGFAVKRPLHEPGEALVPRFGKGSPYEHLCIAA